MLGICLQVNKVCDKPLTCSSDDTTFNLLWATRRRQRKARNKIPAPWTKSSTYSCVWQYGNGSIKLKHPPHLFDRREFLLTLHGQRPQVRLHVLQQFLHRLGAAGRHIFDGVFSNKISRNLKTSRNAGAQPPPQPPIHRGDIIRSSSYSPPSEKKIKTPPSIDTLSPFSASGACEERSDDTGIRSPSSKPADVRVTGEHRFCTFGFVKSRHKWNIWS